MHKVIVERPRSNPGPAKKGRCANLPDEYLPKFEGIKRPYRWRKGQRDLFGPLRRWLQSQVGRPWNDIYSEACTVIHPDDYVRVHVKTHLLEFVVRDTFMHDGQVCVLDTSYQGGPVPVSESRYGRARFYVHPETGLLQVIPMISRRTWRPLERKPTAPEHWVNRNTAIKQIRGLWYECHYEDFPLRPWRELYDYALEQMVFNGRGLPRLETRYRPCIAKRQLSKRELRRLGLRNAPLLTSTGAQSSTGFSRCRLNTALQVRVGLPCPRIFFNFKPLVPHCFQWNGRQGKLQNLRIAGQHNFRQDVRLI